jgi:hypothetical protein
LGEIVENAEVAAAITAVFGNECNKAHKVSGSYLQVTRPRKPDPPAFPHPLQRLYWYSIND